MENIKIVKLDDFVTESTRKIIIELTESELDLIINELTTDFEHLDDYSFMSTKSLSGKARKIMLLRNKLTELKFKK